MDDLVMSMDETSSLNIHERKAIETKNTDYVFLVTVKAHPRDEL
jgi:hypothetical protein